MELDVEELDDSLLVPDELSPLEELSAPFPPPASLFAVDDDRDPESFL